MAEVNDGSAPFSIDGIRDRVDRLARQRQAILAAACAQRISAHAAATDHALVDALTACWDAVRSERPPAQRLAADLESRADVDEDHVAGTIYALRAAAGSPGAGWWAVSRFIDAAFELAPDADGLPQFRPLAEDAQLPAVGAELTWLDVTLSLVESALPNAVVISTLQPPARPQ